MKRIFIQCLIGLWIAAISIAGFSCSNDKTGKSASDQKVLEESRKALDKSKKIAVAKVNGEEITMAQLIGRVNLLAPNYLRGQKEVTPEMDQKIKHEALDILIFRELAIQEAIRQGMRAQPDVVDARVKELKAQAGTAEEVKKRLALGGETEDSLRKLTERNILFHMISDQEISSKVKLDEGQVKKVYRQEKAKFVIPGTLTVEDVFVSNNKDNVSAMKKANDLLARLKKNSDVSKLPFDSTFTVRQGPVTEQEYPNIYKAASKLPKDGLSGVISEKDGLHIIKVKEKKPSKQMSYEEARSFIEKGLRRTLEEQLKSKWEEELKKKAKIEITLAEAEEKMKKAQ